MSDAAITREVNTTLGDYNRANWTTFQKKLGFLVTFPGWDLSSMKYVLSHPIKSSVPPALLTLIANQTLARLGKQQNPEDSTDPFSVHIGEHSLTSPLTRETMAVHIARPLWQAAVEAYHARPVVPALAKGYVREGMHLSGPTLAGLSPWVRQQRRSISPARPSTTTTT